MARRDELLRSIPKIDSLLKGGRMIRASANYSYGNVKSAAVSTLSKIRAEVLSGRRDKLPTISEIEEIVERLAEETAAPALKRVINATGVILHTNLGRAPLGEFAARSVAEAAEGYCNLEYDLETGSRGSRQSHTESLLCELTGAESALVVNNNAAAVFLALNTLAYGESVAVSRGELVEIGGLFRVPDIMRRSGAQLFEVGTTNITRAQDYTDALDYKDAAMLLKVHTSNFKIVGHTSECSIAELAGIARAHGTNLIVDLGSCLLTRPSKLPPPESGGRFGMTAAECVATGADVVCFSGDKLLGAAQAGIILGRREVISEMRKNPFMRMFRPDKLCIAALESALILWRDPDRAARELPVPAMLTADANELKSRAAKLKERLKTAAPGFIFELAAVRDEAGGGSMPGETLGGFAVAATALSMSASALEELLRRRDVPIIARIYRGKLILSVRTLTGRDEDEILAAFMELSASRNRLPEPNPD